MKTTLELPPELSEELARRVATTGRSESDLIIEALLAYLRMTDENWPRSIGMGDDPEINAAEYEDWLKANWRPEDDWGRT